MPSNTHWPSRLAWIILAGAPPVLLLGLSPGLPDGLDEVARPRDRRRVADWVEQLTGQDGRNDDVITSRPPGYRETPITGVTVLQVRAFTEEQVARFVRSWYVAVERESTDSTPDVIVAAAAERCGRGEGDDRAGDVLSRQGRCRTAGAPMSARSRAPSWPGGAPNSRRYSRLNCVGLS